VEARQQLQGYRDWDYDVYELPSNKRYTKAAATINKLRAINTMNRRHVNLRAGNKVVELDRGNEVVISDNDGPIGDHGDSLQPIRERQFMNSRIFDEILENLNYNLRIELEDAYCLWTWHPGMG